MAQKGSHPQPLTPPTPAISKHLLRVSSGQAHSLDFIFLSSSLRDSIYLFIYSQTLKKKGFFVVFLAAICFLLTLL